MAKTIGTLAEAIQRILEGGDVAPTAKHDYREILLHVQYAVADVIRQKAEVDFKKGNRGVDGQFVVAYKNQSVTKDTDLDLYYTTLPESPIALPNDMGVYQVSLMKSQNNSFVALPNGILGLLGAQDAWCLENQVGFWVEDGKIFYHNGNQLSGKNVLLKMVLPGEDSFCAQGYESMIIEMVLRRFGAQIPEDIINDNTNRKDL